MHKKMVAVAIGIVAFAMSAAAQTPTVSTDGSTQTGYVPYFKGSVTQVSDSPISVLNGNVGIGTTGPVRPLDIDGVINARQQGVENNLAYQINGNGSWAQTNLIGHWYTGSQDAISIQVPGYVANSAQMVMLGNGNVGIGTTEPTNLLDIRNGNIGGVNVGVLLNGGHNLDIVSFNRSSNNGAILDATRYGYSIVNNGSTDANNLEFEVYNGGGTQITYDALVIASTGNVGIGTTNPQAKLDVNGSINISGAGAGIIFPSDPTHTPQTMPWTGTACGGDYAESVDVSGDRKSYEPGDVLVIGAESGSDVTKSSEPYSTLVAGIYSTKPGIVGRRQTADAKASPTEVPMAMVGIVPTKVSTENGPVKRGDLLVSSSTVGYAMKGTDRSLMLGAVIGKAMGNLDSGAGVIEVLVTLQ